jgi:hypothetical protein
MSPFTIPSNPVTQQPKGTKPPTTYFGKENSKPERNVDTHILHVENKTKEHLSTVDVERQSVENIATPNKEIIGKFLNTINRELTLRIILPLFNSLGGGGIRAQELSE